MLKTAQRSYLLVTLLTFVAFISLGLPDGLLGVASPSIRHTYSLPLNAIGTIFITGTIGYFLSSLSSGQLVTRLGVGRLLALSSLVTSIALLGYALSSAWWMMVALALFLGLGAGAIDAGLNTYVAAHRSERMMQWLHASFGLGTTLGPMIMTAVLVSNLSWRWGYLLVSGAQFFLAICFFATASMWRDGNSISASPAESQAGPGIGETLRHPGAWLSILMFFVYAGLEYSAGQWSYTLFVEARGIAPDVAGVWLSAYWGLFTVGRITAGIFSTRIGGVRLLQLSMFGAVLAAAILVWNPFPISGLVGVGLLGFSLAPIFPALISSTASRVGLRHTPNTIGFEVAAASIGISILPAALGVLAANNGLEIICVALLAFAIILLGLYQTVRRITLQTESAV